MDEMRHWHAEGWLCGCIVIVSEQCQRGDPVRHNVCQLTLWASCIWLCPWSSSCACAFKWGAWQVRQFENMIERPTCWFSIACAQLVRGAEECTRESSWARTWACLWGTRRSLRRPYARAGGYRARRTCGCATIVGGKVDAALLICPCRTHARAQAFRRCTCQIIQLTQSTKSWCLIILKIILYRE